MRLFKRDMMREPDSDAEFEEFVDVIHRDMCGMSEE